MALAVAIWTLGLLHGASACLTWLRATSSTSGAWTPGTQSGKPQGVCRYISLNTVPLGVEIGKYEPPSCYFTAQGLGLALKQNGTATLDDGYDVVTIDSTKCTVDDSVTVSAAGQALPADAAVAGFRADGTSLGVCFVPDGEGKGSLIAGQLYLSGPRLGQCCWSAGYLEHCRDHDYRVVTATPVAKPTPPPIQPEPTPALLEPKAGVFSARLSFGPRGDPGIMGLTFETPNNTFAQRPGYTPSVWWGRTLASLQPGGDAQTARCSSSDARSCYTDSPVAHYCNMTGLEPSTKYFYKLGDSKVGVTAASEDYTFTTPPLLGAKGPLRTVAATYGDMGLDYSDRTRSLLARLAAEGDFDFVIHNGDISYADNRISSRTKPGVAPSIYIDWMDLFYANVSAYSRRVPYMLSPGNHEYPCNYGEYEARAAMMPSQAAGSTDVQYYSYTVGQTHVVALSGEGGRLSKVDSPEMFWLEQDLAAAAQIRERGEIAFIITHVHYPNQPGGYCSSKMTYCCANGNVGLRSDPEGSEAFAPVHANATGDDACVDHFMTDVNKYTEDLFVKYGVDIHFTAHQHVYERTTPVYRYKAYGNGSEPFPEGNDGSVFVNPKYPINIVNGNPGNVELQDVWLPKPSWSVGLRTNSDGSGGTTPSYYADFGFTKFIMQTGDAHGRKDSLTVQYIDSRDGSTLDEFTIFKDPPKSLFFV